MNSKCFGKKNIMTNISMFLIHNEILSLLFCNKATKNALHPENNIPINNIFYYQVKKTFFEMDEDFELENKEESKRENILENSWKSDINWSKFFSKINSLLKNYPDKEISKKVLDAFKYHIYLLDLRKENYHLELPDSSMHLCFCYDKKYKEECNYNYYGNYINQDYISQKGKGKEIKILKEGYPFEKELKQFIDFYDKINESENYKQIMDYIISYDFEKMEEIFEQIQKNKIFNVNKIIYFLLWLNRSLIMYCMYIIESIIRFKDDNDVKKYLDEYNCKYTNYVNSCLLLNYNFENVNIIVNYINHFIIKRNVAEKFSIYDLGRKIFEKTVFGKINRDIFNKTSFVFKKLLQGELESKYKKEDNEKMELEQGEECSTKDNSFDMDEDMEEESFLECNREKTYKEIFENTIKCICDLVINKNNANAINHSKIILDEVYVQYENNLINTLVEELKYYLSEGKTISEIFAIVEKLLKFDGNSRNFKFNPNSLKLINRTKEKLIEESYKLLMAEVLVNIMNDFCERLKPNKNGRTLNISSIELMNNNNYSGELSDLSRNEIMNVERKVQGEINNLKTYLLENSINGYTVEETNKLINEYIENNGIDVVLLMKKMIYFYYRELQICEDKNQKVYEILSYKSKETMISSLNNAIK